MTDIAWIDAALTSARPQAIGALLRFFRDLDKAEEAFQEACLRALQRWPENGPPRDPIAWLIFVARNAGIDTARRRTKERPLSEGALSNLDDAEAAIAQQIDEGDYRDDILRLLFVCCDPDLPATQQVALALRIVCGMPVRQIARAFLVTEAAMEQRITRAKARVADAGIPFEAPARAARLERLSAVCIVVYLIFNEGYSASGQSVGARAPLCDEAIRLGRLLVRMFPDEPSLMGLLALMLIQHARTPARLSAAGEIILLEDQDRSLWKQPFIAEGLALIDKAMRHGERAEHPYVIQAAIASMHARAARPEDTDWRRIDALYASLERIQPSPVVTLNRAVAAWKVRGAADALEMVEPLAAQLGGYFYFHGVRGALLVKLGRAGEAREAFDRAIALASSAAEALHIRKQIDLWMDQAHVRK